VQSEHVPWLWQPWNIRCAQYYPAIPLLHGPPGCRYSRSASQRRFIKGGAVAVAALACFIVLIALVSAPGKGDDSSGPAPDVNGQTNGNKNADTGAGGLSLAAVPPNPPPAVPPYQPPDSPYTEPSSSQPNSTELAPAPAPSPPPRPSPAATAVANETDVQAILSGPDAQLCNWTSIYLPEGTAQQCEQLSHACHALSHLPMNPSKSGARAPACTPTFSFAFFNLRHQVWSQPATT
jgi:hypothetical protein